MSDNRRRRTVTDWLRWQGQLHHEVIELGLERIRPVASRLLRSAPAIGTIVVAGTNGKGSTVRLLESVYHRAGYKVGAYTSPHLLRYNERIRVATDSVDDRQLIDAFAAVEAARRDRPLTAFEFGTLAALWLFDQADLDLRVLEVGLGGRLDAVNLVDADVAVITAIGLDHQDWLGPDRESIGREKAGIMRCGRPVVCSDPRPPASIADSASRCGARLLQRGRDFDIRRQGSALRWSSIDGDTRNLPLPELAGPGQIDNLAGVVAAVDCLHAAYPVAHEALGEGLQQVRLSGRAQRLPGNPEIWIDVGHNPEALAGLAQLLSGQGRPGSVGAIVGMLGDKRIGESIVLFRDLVDRWQPITLEDPRALARGEMQRRVAGIVGAGRTDPELGIRDAWRRVRNCGHGRIIIFGSFVTVADALRTSGLDRSCFPDLDFEDN